MFKLIFIGDIVGKPGRTAIKEILPELKLKFNPDFVIGNGENAAGGVGITESTAHELFESGINFLTMGNHVWDKKEALKFIEKEDRIIRPANYPPGTPGFGSKVVQVGETNVGIINISGRTFMPALDCPFRGVMDELEKIKETAKIIIVDFHAEATSEKIAMGWYLDGKVSAVFGTHTHIQTADERIFPKGTAYITDVGMTGPRDSIIGMEKEIIIQKFVTQLPVRFEVAKGDYELNAVYVEINPASGNAIKIERIRF